MNKGVTLQQRVIDSFVRNCGDNKEADVIAATSCFGAAIINSFSSADFGDWTPMGKAAARGHFSVLEHLCCHGGDLDHTSSKYGYNPLMEAADNNQVKCLEFIISRGAALDAQDRVYGNTALHLAVYKGYKDCVVRLLEAGASTSITNNDGKFAVGMTSRAEIKDMFIFEMSWRADVEELIEMYGAPLVQAVLRGDKPRIKQLLSEGADTHAVTMIYALRRGVEFGRQDGTTVVPVPSWGSSSKCTASPHFLGDLATKEEIENEDFSIVGQETDEL